MSDDSSIIVNTRGGNGLESKTKEEKSETTESHISTIMFLLQHHLQHLIIGFGMSTKSSLPNWTLMKQLPYE